MKEDEILALLHMYLLGWFYFKRL